MTEVKEMGAHIVFVTPVCNNRCLMCCAPVDAAKMREHPPFEEYTKKEIDELTNVREVYLTGGEPTTSPHIFRVIRYIKSRHPGAVVNMVTNGRMFSYMNFAKRMSTLGINKIVTEIHGPSADLHDRITRADGSFAQTVAGIKNLVSLNQNVELRTIVHRMNYERLPEIASFIAKNLKGVNCVVIFPFNIVSHAVKNLEKLDVTYSEIVPYCCRAAELLESSGFTAELFHTPFCVVDRKYWKFIRGVTAEAYKISLLDECGKCTKKGECPLVWKSYVNHHGPEEFRAIASE